MTNSFGHFIVGACVLMISEVTAAANASVQPALCNANSETQRLDYQGGRFNAVICNVPLGTIIDQLGRKSGERIQLESRAARDVAVDVSFRGLELDDALTRVLEDFSYVFYRSRGKYVVKLMSNNSAVRPGSKSHPLNLSERPLKSAEEPNNISSHLDTALETAEALSQDRLIDSTLTTLSAENRPLDENSLDSIIGFDDPRVTEILVAAAMKETTRLPREQAVEALWKHTASLQYADVESVEALRRLAEDSDERISAAASQALHEMLGFFNEGAVLAEAVE